MSDFEEDVRLVFTNCFTYNRAGTEVVLMADELEKVFDRVWNKGQAVSSTVAKLELARKREKTEGSPPNTPPSYPIVHFIVKEPVPPPSEPVETKAATVHSPDEKE